MFYIYTNSYLFTCLSRTSTSLMPVFSSKFHAFSHIFTFYTSASTIFYISKNPSSFGYASSTAGKHKLQYIYTIIYISPARRAHLHPQCSASPETLPVFYFYPPQRHGTTDCEFLAPLPAAVARLFATLCRGRG